MPDITMCTNSECPLRVNCYRYRAIPDQHWQSYSRFEPNERFMEPTKDRVTECDHLWIALGRPLRPLEEADQINKKEVK